MLSFFPDLYNYSYLVPVVLRLFLGLYLIKIALENFGFWRKSGGKNQVFIRVFLPALGGILFLLGFLIQPTGFVLAIFLFALVRAGRGMRLAYPKSSDLELLLIVLILSLVFLGPGPWSIDLPL